MANQVAVIASLNQDITVEAPRIPLAGETILGSAVRYSRGGKGGNHYRFESGPGPGHQHPIGAT